VTGRRAASALASGAAAAMIVWSSASCASRPRAAARPVAPPGPKSVAEATPSAPVLPPVAPPILRVGLASDVAEFTLPAPGAPWIVSGGEETALFAGPLTFRPHGGGGVVRIQTGAFSEEGAARAAAAEMGKRTGLEASIAFSAEKGLYRVRLGAFGDARAAADAQAKLQAAGISGFPVTESSGNAALLMRDQNIGFLPVCDADGRAVGAITTWRSSLSATASMAA